MLNDICDAIAKEAREIYRQLEACRAVRARSSNCGGGLKGGLMARLLKQSEAKKLSLPRAHVVGAGVRTIGSNVTFRIAEIAVPKAGDPARGPHLHDGFEECIYVLKGNGVTWPRAAKSRSSRATSC